MSEEQNKVDVETTNVEETNPPVESEETVNPITEETAPEIDYKTKFSESSKESLRLLEESKAKDAEIERLRGLAESGATHSNESESLYPGFEDLDQEQQASLVAYTNSIANKVRSDVQKDPAFTFAKESYNSTKWNEAFDEVSSQYPELKTQKEDFRSKYYRKDNVPENIGELLGDIAKIYLFDKARDIGSREAQEQANRLDVERTSGGQTTPQATRTLDDWAQMAQDNPAKFAQNAGEYKKDLESGKLK